MKYQSADLTRPGLPNIRMLVVHFATISVSLGTAVSAFGRLALYLVALWIIVSNVFTNKHATYGTESIWIKRLHILTLVTIIFMATSILWSNADLAKAVSSWTRHARLLTIPLLWILVRDKSEALSVLRVFVIAQLFVVVSSWLLIWQIPVPWATATNAKTTYAVFGSYLEQSITEATIAFILWYQRSWIFGKNGRLAAIAVALITVIHVLGFLVGRSGYLVVLALASISIIYQLPKRKRWLAVVIPFATAMLIFGGFKAARDRIVLVKQEVAAYAQHADSSTSSGLRLLYWQTSLRSIAEKPLLGSGSGGWNHEFRRLTNEKLDPDYYTVDNPHQMFLLWAVEGGMVGFLLLCSLLVSIYMHSRLLAESNGQSLQSALAALVVAGFTTSTIYGIGMGDYFCMLIGILLCTGHNAVRQLNPI